MALERSGELGAPGRVLVVPGGLDQQSAGVAVAALGDAAAVLLFARGVLARGQPEVARKLARVAEAAKVADLEHSQRTGSAHGSVVATCSSS